MTVISCTFVAHLRAWRFFVVSYESRARDFLSHLGRLNVYTKTEITLTENTLCDNFNIESGCR